MIRKMVENGMNISDIARELNMDRKTVKKYMNSRAVPKYKERKKRVHKLDPYRDYIKERIDRYNLSAVRIFDEIRKKGYNGGYSTLKAYCHTLRKDRAITAVVRFETEPGKQAQQQRNSICLSRRKGGGEVQGEYKGNSSKELRLQKNHEHCHKRGKRNNQGMVQLLQAHKRKFHLRETTEIRGVETSQVLLLRPQATHCVFERGRTK